LIGQKDTQIYSSGGGGKNKAIGKASSMFGSLRNETIEENLLKDLAEDIQSNEQTLARKDRLHPPRAEALTEGPAQRASRNQEPRADVTSTPCRGAWRPRASPGRK
jgi:hypothetical protein